MEVADVIDVIMKHNISVNFLKRKDKPETKRFPLNYNLVSNLYPLFPNLLFILCYFLHETKLFCVPDAIIHGLVSFIHSSVHSTNMYLAA